MRSGSSLPPPREHKGQGYYEIGVARLTENLAAGDHATATIQRQNPSTAAFSDSEADDAEVEIYDSLEFLSSTDSEILASGCIVIFWRNPATGFRNLIGSPCCPSTEA
jgi:hypothetical protein